MTRDLRALLLGLGIAASAAQVACNKSPGEPAGPSAAAPKPDAGADAGIYGGEDNFHARPRDSKGNLIPESPAPPLASSDVAPVGRAPDWDLDRQDPAQDYVERYIQSTSRYGDETACVHAQASTKVGDRTLVEARDTAGTGCKGSNAVRDTFAVDVPKDRLALADPKAGKALGPWPDGSDPGGAPATSPQEANLSTSPLRDKLKAMQLVPLRMQRYGRGSYDVVTIAGWHADVFPEAGAADTDDVARRICAVSKRPMGLFAGMDRKTILRVKCPGQGRFETL
jgi:hypothetical protein